jgi:hypothetical protein
MIGMARLGGPRIVWYVGGAVTAESVRLEAVVVVRGSVRPQVVIVMRCFESSVPRGCPSLDLTVDSGVDSRVDSRVGTGVGTGVVVLRP